MTTICGIFVGAGTLGADPDVADLKGRTAVMIAARYGHEQSVKKLAEKNANMKLRDKRGEGLFLNYTLENVVLISKYLLNSSNFDNTAYPEIHCMF